MKQAIIIGNQDRISPLVAKISNFPNINILKSITLSNIESINLNLNKVDIIFSTISMEIIKQRFRIGQSITFIGPKQINVLLDIIDEYNQLLKKHEYRKKTEEIIINSIHDAMIIINKECKITLINKSARELLGADIKYINQPVKEVVPNTRLDKVLKNGKKEINKLQSLGERKIVTNRVPVRDEAGNVIAAVAIFRDVTEVKNLAEELTDLKEIRSMLEEIIYSTQDAISVVDAEGKGIMINSAYTTITGLSEEDVIGKPATVDIAEGESMHLQVLKTKKPVFGVPMKVGPKRKDVIVNVAPIIVDDKLKGSVGVIHDVSKIKKLSTELSEAKRQLRVLKAKYTFNDIVGDTPEMIDAINQAKNAASTPATILLRGESGTGKELFAHAIHNASKRKNNKFVRVNCPAISDSLLESELFGYEEGAFTGAQQGGRKGLFEEADKGTIFLDEVGKLDFKLQSKLLRVLQEKEITRVGGNEPQEVDVRVIVATNADLEQEVKSGCFRKDLYYRLNVIPIFIPSLEQRKADIPKIVKVMLQKYTQEYGKLVKNITPEALEKLMKYDWPGNVRELENIIGRTIINMGIDEEVIKVNHLPLLTNTNLKKSTDNKHNLKLKSFNIEDKTLSEVVNQAEKQAINLALKKTKGNRKEAAKLLDISIRSLYYKLDKFQLK